MQMKIVIAEMKIMTLIEFEENCFSNLYVRELISTFYLFVSVYIRMRLSYMLIFPHCFCVRSLKFVVSVIETGMHQRLRG